MNYEFLDNHIQSQAVFIRDYGYGYGQVEPNHLAAQSTKESYAQLPANKDIQVLEQGQFVKYDYLNGEVNFTGEGEWMLVFNEIKLYHEHQSDCEFAMIRDNYAARVYSPFGYAQGGNANQIAGNFNEGLEPSGSTKHSRYYNGVDADGNDSITITDANGDEHTYKYADVTAGLDYYEPNSVEDPFHIFGAYKPAMMPEGTTMVPRVLKTHVGDIMTTNMIGDSNVSVGNILSPRADDGILSVDGDGSMSWQVVKIYTMPDHQPGVKVMRIG